MNTKTNNGKTRKTAKTLERLTWQEAQHYQEQFEKLLEEKLGKPYAEMASMLQMLDWFKDEPVNEWGQKQINRARNLLKKFVKKYAPPKAA